MELDTMVYEIGQLLSRFEMTTLLIAGALSIPLFRIDWTLRCMRKEAQDRDNTETP